MPNYSNTDYDIGKAFEAIENELMESMIRNLKRHKVEEANEDKQWTMWQTEQLKSLEKYKRVNQAKYQKRFKEINKQVAALLQIAHQEGGMEQEIAILEAIKKGFQGKKLSAASTAEFFRLNERKLEALIKATTDDLKKAEVAVLRMANDQYRQIIYNAQVYANTGAGTYEKAVDMASKDFLSRGINCIEYKNGARHTIGDYAEMAIRTASKRAYLQGEGAKRQEWGISTVILNKRGNPCPKCLPFCGKVFIDDVWSGGKKEDGNYPLLSKAIAKGLYHPRCKDSHTTYFQGISEPPNGKYTKEELELIEKENQAAAQEQYAKRQVERFGRLAKHSLDPENQKQYAAKQAEWKQKVRGLGAADNFIDIPEHKPPVLKRVIDYNDKKAITDALQEFEARAVNREIETACVITRTGEVYECYGIKDRVFVDADLREKLYGAYVSHNHPVNYTEYSFSSDDFELFMKYELAILRGEDVKYQYEFTRNSKVIDAHKPIFEITEEDYAHESSITNAENAGIGYRRWKYEQR